MVLKLGDGLEVFINKKVATRRLRRWVIGTAFVCLILGVGLGLAWSLAQRRSANFPPNCALYCKQGYYIERLDGK